ncbi:DNA polymerase III subunit delta [Lacticaseibacillus brantae]|nr:DNA polymerase III subunit delta [Lacticaseibacillus brantae]
MDIQAFQKLTPLPPVLLVLGTEAALQTQVLDRVKAIVPEDQQAMNFSQYDLSQTPLAVALDDAMSAPFFGDYRVVVVNNPSFLTGETKVAKIDHDIDGLIQYVEAPLASTILVIIANYPKLDERKRVTKAVKKAATLVDVAPLDERAARKQIAQMFKTHHLTITPDALNLLVQRTNGDYSLMMSEVQKLLTYSANGAPLDAGAIEALVPKQLSDRVFDLVGAVVAKDSAKSLRLYRDLLAQNEEPIRLNALLVNQFRLLLQVQILAKKGYTQGSLAEVIKVHPYRIKLAWQQSQRIPARELHQAYIGLVDAEAQMKQGVIDKALAFELFVLQYTRQ